MNRAMSALTYRGASRIRLAWLMATATYAYSRGYELTRWESFCGAVELFFDYLRKEE